MPRSGWRKGICPPEGLGCCAPLFFAAVYCALLCFRCVPSHFIAPCCPFAAFHCVSQRSIALRSAPLCFPERLTRLYMADFALLRELGGLCMAPNRRYAEYERCNCAAHTWRIAFWVPYISHLVVSTRRNLPQISEVASFLASGNRFSTPIKGTHQPTREPQPITSRSRLRTPAIQNSRGAAPRETPEAQPLGCCHIGLRVARAQVRATSWPQWPH